MKRTAEHTKFIIYCQVVKLWTNSSYECSFVNTFFSSILFFFIFWLHLFQLNKILRLIVYVQSSPESDWYRFLKHLKATVCKMKEETMYVTYWGSAI